MCSEQVYLLIGNGIWSLILKKFTTSLKILFSLTEQNKLHCEEFYLLEYNAV
jgi:hypothetical protein